MRQLRPRLHVSKIFLMFLLVGLTMSCKVRSNGGTSQTLGQKTSTESKDSNSPYEVQQLTLSGVIEKNNSNESLRFDVQLGTPSFKYTLQGSPLTNKGIVYQSDISFNGVVVTKMVIHDGRQFIKQYKNEGTIQVFPRYRTLKDVTFADIKMGGSIVAGAIDDGIWFDKHEMFGKDTSPFKSSGIIDYNATNGHYNAKKLQFGDVLIAGMGGNCVFDYDSLFQKNSIVWTLNFGNLNVTGMVSFTDTTKSNKTDTEVTATRGNLNLTVQKADGKPIRLAHPDEEDTDDDIMVRKFIAFLELIAFDVWAE